MSESNVVHLSVRSKAVVALECERDALFEKANRITRDQMAIMEAAYNNVLLLSNEQEKILLKMAAVEESLAKLMGVV